MSKHFRLVFLGLLVLLSSCDGKRQTLVDVGNQKQIMHVGNGDEIQSVDPHVTTGMPEYHVELSLYEGLVSKNPETLAIVPAVADHWTVSPDGLVYRFHIRDNARWSNGDKLIADDFVQSWLRGLMPALGNEYASSLYVIKNGKEINEGTADPATFGAVALDSQTLEVTLNAPTPYFLQLLDHHSTFPVHIKTIKKFGRLDERGTKWIKPENFVSNGPFKLNAWVPNNYLSVVKNPNYWDAANVKLNEVRYYPIPKTTIEEAMYRAGQLHATYYLAREKYKLYKNSNNPALRSTQQYATYFYRFNTTVKPLNDVRVRKALAYSIDRKKIVEQVTKFGQTPAYTLTPPDKNGYAPRAAMPFDINLAKRLLSEAGYPEGKGFPKLVLAFNTADEHKHIAEAIQQMWKANLGIDVSLQNMEWKVFLERERLMDFQVDRSSWVGDYLDPNTFLEMFITDNGNNRTGFSNKKYDELMAKAASEVDQVKRFEYFQEAESILVEEVPIIPFYTYRWNRLVSPSVQGWHENIMDYFPFKYMSLTSKKGL